MKLTSIDRKQTKDGSPYIIAFVDLHDGQEDAKGTIWKRSKYRADFPNFDALEVGDEIDAVLKVSGDYMNIEPSPSKNAPQRSFTPNKGTPQAITKAMDRKEESIEKFQNNKQEAIALAGAMRDATLVSLASLKDQPFPTDAEFKEEWTKWVQFFLAKGSEPFI